MLSDSVTAQIHLAYLIYNRAETVHLTVDMYLIIDSLQYQCQMSGFI